MRQLKRTVKIGNITIGGTNPIAVQTMLNVPVKDIAGNVEQAKRVAKAGCQIVRVTVPTPELPQNTLSLPSSRARTASSPSPVPAFTHSTGISEWA